MDYRFHRQQGNSISDRLNSMSDRWIPISDRWSPISDRKRMESGGRRRRNAFQNANYVRFFLSWKWKAKPIIFSKFSKLIEKKLWCIWWNGNNLGHYIAILLFFNLKEKSFPYFFHFQPKFTIIITTTNSLIRTTCTTTTSEFLWTVTKTTQLETGSKATQMRMVQHPDKIMKRSHPRPLAFEGLTVSTIMMEGKTVIVILLVHLFSIFQKVCLKLFFT